MQLYFEFTLVDQQLSAGIPEYECDVLGGKKSVYRNTDRAK